MSWFGVFEIIKLFFYTNANKPLSCLSNTKVGSVYNFMKYFITAIDTDIGKTVVSAILARAFNYPYWKPIQSGDLDNSDTMKILDLSAPCGLT